MNQTFFFRGNDLDMNVEGAWRQGITGKGKLNKILFSCFMFYPLDRRNTKY